MPIHLDHNTLTAYLQRFLTYNKARGMIAELALNSELGIHGAAGQKLLAGGWLVSPQVNVPQTAISFPFSLNCIARWTNYSRPLMHSSKIGGGKPLLLLCLKAGLE